MKKIFIILIWILASSPVFAVCSITGGACSVPVNPETNSLKNKPVFDNSKKLQKTDYSKPPAKTPNGINANTKQKLPKVNLETGNYNE